MTDQGLLRTDVLIIGAGPAGLSAAASLAPRLRGGVLVLEREAAAGGIPRHSDHAGFGVRDLRRFMSGPAYAQRLLAAAVDAGAVIRTNATVTGWSGERCVEVTSPAGRSQISARVVILATGARERPRSARLVPGDRPAGVYTTGQLQNLVHLHQASPGTRALIVGAELVSWSAALTLRGAGARPILMTSQHRSPECYRALAVAGRVALRLPVRTRTKVVRIIGRGRVEAVELEHLDTGARSTVPCDSVVFTGDWIPDHEIARAAGLELDPHTLGPVIDTAQATSVAGIYAIGNLTHPVDTADVAALDGRAVATRILTDLSVGNRGRAVGPRLIPGPNLRWISPGVVDPSVLPPRERFLAWPRRQIARPMVTLTRDGETLVGRTLPWPASPGRVLRIPAAFISGVNLAAGEITVDVHSTRAAGPS